MVRLRAVERARGQPGTEEVLLAALQDRDYPIVRREAVRAARGVREVRVVKELIRLVGEDPAAEVREEAVEALGTLLGRRANGS
jgi:HEAT repeat protein